MDGPHAFELAQAFAMMAGRGGAITKKSLKDFFARFGERFTDDELDYVIDQLRGDEKTHAVDRKAFAASMDARLQLGSTTPGVFGDVFDVFDKSSTGTLSSRELRSAMSMMSVSRCVLRVPAAFSLPLLRQIHLLRVGRW